MDMLSYAWLGVGWNYLSMPKLQRLQLGIDKKNDPILYNGCNWSSKIRFVKEKYPCAGITFYLGSLGVVED